MGEILSFPAKVRRKPQTSSPSGGGAQIVFFTGVRYERAEVPQSKPKPARRATTKPA